MDLLQKDIPILAKIYEAKCFYDSRNNRILLYYKNHVTARTLVDSYNLPTTPPPNSSLYVIYDLQTGIFNVSTDPPTYRVSNSKVYVTSPINAEYDMDKVIIYRISSYEMDTAIDLNYILTQLNADKVDGFHASLTPAPNVIVPLNANGILDLSATYVKSDVYTFRRVDLTNATSDYELQVGEEAYISFSNATSVPLRIATQSGTYYECHLICSNAYDESANFDPIFLNPNNTQYTNAFVYATIYRNSIDLGHHYSTYSAFRCGWLFSNCTFFITNFTQYKNVKGVYDVYGSSIDTPTIVVFSTDWKDSTTVWTSLGTITFPQPTSGYILVRRLA